MQTLQAFATASRTLSSNAIYEMFEAAPDAQRDEIYKLASSDSQEPAREALNKLGYMFHVAALINY